MLLDGSMGALIFSHKPDEAFYRGEPFRSHPVALQNCTEALVLSQPRFIEDIHRAYLEAGADIIETCTFNGNRMSLEDFMLDDRVAGDQPAAPPRLPAVPPTISRGAIRTSAASWPAASGRPTRRCTSSRAASIRAPAAYSFDQFVDMYYRANRSPGRRRRRSACSRNGQRYPGAQGGPVRDRQIPRRARRRAADHRCAERSTTKWPDAIQHDARGVLRVGGTVRRAGGRVQLRRRVDLLRSPLETVAQISRKPIVCYPNAGLPDGMGGFVRPRPRGHGEAARRIRTQRLAQHRRRLLRHHARLDRRHRHADRRRAAAPRSRICPR